MLTAEGVESLLGITMERTEKSLNPNGGYNLCESGTKSVTHGLDGCPSKMVAKGAKERERESTTFSFSLSEMIRDRSIATEEEYTEKDLGPGSIERRILDGKSEELRETL